MIICPRERYSQKADQMGAQLTFTKQECASLQLMQNDLRFVYMLARNREKLHSNYIASSQPYFGMIIDGAEDWINSYNNSHKTGFTVPTFTAEQQVFYEKMRGLIKLWDTSYEDIYHRLKTAYTESRVYFSSVCAPLAKYMKLYDIFGADIVDGKYCGNTILCNLFTPDYILGSENGERIKRLAAFAGRYVAVFGATKEYLLNDEMEFHTVDYGGFRKSPVGNEFSDKFVLFSMLCQINYILKCIDAFIHEETTTKLRFAYILYYYIVGILPEINAKLSTSFSTDFNWYSREFRNSMAHYKLGKVLKESEMVFDDPFYGLTQKFLGTDYNTVKQAVMSALASLAEQIEEYLKIEKEVKVYD